MSARWRERWWEALRFGVEYVLAMSIALIVTALALVLFGRILDWFAQ